jgi:hypothetical protein
LTSSPSSPNFASPRTKSTLAEFKVRRTRWCPGKRAGCVERRGRRNGKKGKTSRTETVGDKRGRVEGDKKRQRGKQSRQSQQHIINAQKISRAAKIGRQHDSKS